MLKKLASDTRGYFEGFTGLRFKNSGKCHDLQRKLKKQLTKKWAWGHFGVLGGKMSRLEQF